MDYATQAAEKVANLYECGMGGVFFVNECNVNIDDLIHCAPGHIVRVFGNPSENIKFFPGNNEMLGCVAGWVSE